MGGDNHGFGFADFDRRFTSLMGTLRSQKFLIYLFFFSSGMPALAYQLTWQRVLFRVFGVNMESVTIVVTAFMLGLGIGSLIGSWLALRRSFAPLLLIAAIEASIGFFGLFSLQLFDWADQIVQLLPFAAKVLSAIGLVFIPTALMGMTLPLLVGHLIRQSANVGLSTGGLYSANTFGAVIGCLACAFGLFPWLGLQAAIWVAASLNGLIALAAFIGFIFQRGAEFKSNISDNTKYHAPVDQVFSFTASLCISFFAGFISLSYEIFLLRLASFGSGTAAPMLALTLAIFLLGVVGGARTATEWCVDHKSSGELGSKVVQLLLFNGIVGLAILPILSASAPLGGGVLGLLLLGTYAIARCLGVIFPLLAHLAVLPDARAGGRVGLVLLADILGSAAGSMLTGFVLADILSAQNLAVLLSALTFFLAIPFISISNRSMRSFVMPLAVSLAIAATLIIFQKPLSAGTMESLLYKATAKDNPPLARLVENRDGIIAVSPSGTVYGGGAYDGRFNIDLVHDTNGIIRPYGLSLYSPNPRDVLMIGLSSGSWGQVIANNPYVDHLTIIEINPGYTQLIRERPELSSLLVNPKVQIVIDDGRRWLKQHPELRFDAIIANTAINYRSNAVNVLSVEFDRLIQAHLKPGGVYFFNATDSKRVERTGCKSFKYGYRVFNHMLVSNAPFDLNLDRWRKTLIAYKIDGKPMLHMDRPRDVAVLRGALSVTTDVNSRSPDADKRQMESCSNILSRTSGLKVITDDNMGTEWRHIFGLE